MTQTKIPARAAVLPGKAPAKKPAAVTARPKQPVVKTAVPAMPVIKKATARKPSSRHATELQRSKVDAMLLEVRKRSQELSSNIDALLARLG